MNEDDKKKALEKWAPIMNSMGVTGSKADLISQYVETHSLNEQQSDTLSFPSLLPTAIKVAARTISQDIGGFASQEEIDAVKARVQSENRDGKIDSVIESKEFTEKKLEDDPEYKELKKKGVTPMSLPKGNLFYLDFRYDDEDPGKE